MAEESRHSHGRLIALSLVLAVLSFIWLWHGENVDSVRHFLYVGSEPTRILGYDHRTYPLDDPFHGVRFGRGTTLELLGSDDDIFTVTSWGGNPVSFERHFYIPGWGAPYETVESEALTVPWDVAHDRPLCMSDPLSPGRAFLLWLSLGGWRYLVIVLPGLFLIAFASIDNKAWLLTLIALAMVVIPSMIGSMGLPDEACQFRHQLDRYRAPGGHLFPVGDYRIVAPYGDQRDFDRIQAGSQVSIVMLILASPALAMLIFPAIRGAHYLVVPHPVERFVRRGKDGVEIDTEGFAANLGREDINQPPPEFVIKNKTRRIQNLTDLVRAEREAAEEAVRHERARKAIERKK